MSDNGEEAEDEPVVELGDGPDVEGAPVSRVASRLFFPIEESEVLRREGETTVRTPDGPQTVADVLEQSDEVYFEKNADLVNAVRSVVGTGPVPTVGGGSDAGGDSEPESEPAPDADEEQDTGEESQTAEPEEGPEGAGESDDEEVAEDAETAESPPTEPEEDEGNRDGDAADGEADADEEGEFEFDDQA